MAKRCERCLTAFDDTTQTCPYCGSNTEQDQRSLEQLSNDGYLVSRRLLSRTKKSTALENATNTECAPNSNPAVEHTSVYNLPRTSHGEWTHIEPVHIDVDDELERLRRGYEMSVAASETSEYEREPERTQHTSAHTGQQDTSGDLRETRTVEPPATQTVDELIESLRVNISQTAPEAQTGTTVLTHQESADTTVWLPSVTPDSVERDNIETLSEMREKADREYRKIARREAFVGLLRDFTTPGTIPHRIVTALFLVLCIWLLIVYVLPAMVGAVVVTIESLLPYLIGIGLLIYAFRLLIHP